MRPPALDKAVLERAAIAARRQWAGGAVCAWEDLSEGSKHEYRELARAVLSAVSETAEANALRAKADRLDRATARFGSSRTKLF